MTSAPMLSPVSALRSVIAGMVIVPADADYDLARLAWDLGVDQRPALILFPASIQDIAEAIRFAHEQCLGIAIQSDGRALMLPARDCLLIITSHNPIPFECGVPASAETFTRL